MAKALVIVESPAKAKTIEKYLGADYKVTASVGHLRDLPKSKLGVDIEGGFIPEYKPIKGKEEIIDELKKAAAKSKVVYLATDPDREGEAISWHLKELLELPDKKTLRVTFNEITKKVVCESITKPRSIDQDLVDAQQARRVLDRIVGYKLSPLLWSKIRRGLSAGRVQSAVTRMVVDRENEIRAFTPEEYWLLDAVLKCADGGSITAHFYGKSGEGSDHVDGSAPEDRKTELRSAEDAEKVINAVSNSSFVITELKRADKHRSPAPPFITSSLQQEASRRLNMTPRRTMSVAQQLYEGIEISGEGSVGLITYMRTDSLRISEEASAAAREYIIDSYGREYCPAKARSFKTAKGAQDAHEAIRPSNIALAPEKIRSDLNSDQYRLYKLIWSRFMASQMSSAVYDNVSADIVSAGYVFKFSHSVMKFPGFTKVYDSGTGDAENLSELPKLAQGDELGLDRLVKEQKFTQPPARYTEDTLIGAMKEKGIGRPSTYAPTVSTIMDREYVVKDGKSLRPTNLGEVVTAFMCERFSDIANPAFTARMEENLDKIEEGERNWKDVLGEFYDGFEKNLEKAVKDTEGVRIKVPPEVSDEICPNCGKNLVVKSGRFGRFLACPDYPNCTFTMPIVTEMPGKCPKCGSRILKRTSKKGYPYYACEKGAECGFMTWDVPTKDNCPECGHTMFKKSGRGYKRPFCINESCSKFVPEDKRGYKKKTAADGGAEKKTQEASK